MNEEREQKPPRWTSPVILNPTPYTLHPTPQKSPRWTSPVILYIYICIPLLRLIKALRRVLVRNGLVVVCYEQARCYRHRHLQASLQAFVRLFSGIRRALFRLSLG